jgi:asparagine N-glycosylation enzyme membrane subunit Stt3
LTYNQLPFIGGMCSKLNLKLMKKHNLPLFLIIVSFILIILNFIFTSDEMNSGFWLRITGSVLLIIAMALTIRDRKKRNNNAE